MHDGSVREIVENGEDVDSDHIMAVIAGGKGYRHAAERRHGLGFLRDQKFSSLIILVVLNVLFGLTSRATSSSSATTTTCSSRWP